MKSVNFHKSAPINWLPVETVIGEASRKLPSPSFLDVFELDSSTKFQYIDLGNAARNLIDNELPKSKGVILIRGLPMRNSLEFSQFWDSCRGGLDSNLPGWETMEYNSFGKPRDTEYGVDLATNIPNQLPLPLHNEMVYNPLFPSKIILYCIQDAKEGGDSLIGLNSELTKLIPNSTHDLLTHCKGVKYERLYYDATTVNVETILTNSPFKMSWQEKCQIDSSSSLSYEEQKKFAIQCFQAIHFQDENIWFDEHGTLHVLYISKGYIKD